MSIVTWEFESTPLHLFSAEIAQLVEHNLAKVGVAGPSPVFRSIYVPGCRGSGIVFMTLLWAVAATCFFRKFYFVIININYNETSLKDIVVASRLFTYCSQ